MRIPRGFSMVEIIIVVAVISILASILMPNFTQSRDKAKLKACISNEKSIFIAAEMYANDNQGLYPNAPFSPNGGMKIKNGCLLCTLEYLPPYPARCPAAPSGYYYWLASDSPFNASFVWCSSITPGCHNSLGISNSYPRYYSDKRVKENP